MESRGEFLAIVHVIAQNAKQAAIGFRLRTYACRNGPRRFSDYPQTLLGIRTPRSPRVNREAAVFRD
jgi:hypothetical protein